MKNELAIEITKKKYLMLQEEGESLEMDIAMGRDYPETTQRLALISRMMDASQWVLHPDHGCILKSELI